MDRIEGCKNNQKYINKIGIYASSVVLPLLIIVCALYRSNIYPFGDNTLVYHDMQYQYTDFFMWFSQVLRGKDSWLYSFHAGLGGNIVALVAYYLASPLNFLLLLVPVEKIAQFLTLLIIFKLVLCSMTVCIYLCTRFRVDSIYVIFASTSYALMGYNILQCSNIMWLDGVIILPILALGIHKIIYEKKYGIYYWALFYGIVSNWYIGYMLCIFSVIYFGIELLLFYEEKIRKIADIVNKTMKFGFCSILSLMGSCFLFLPQTLQMLKQGEGVDSSIMQPDFAFSYLDGFRDLYLEGGKLTQSEGIPPIFIGTYIFFIVILFFLSKKISAYKKVVFNVVLLGFMLMLCFKPLNYMFTGFKYPSNHYYRQAFIFSFFMIVVTGVYLKEKCLMQEKENILKSVAIIVGAGLFFDLLKNYEPHKTVYMSCLIAIVVGGGIWWTVKKKKQICKWTAIIIIAVCMLCEFSEKMVMEFEDHVQSASAYMEYNQKIKSEIDELKAKDENFDMYRLDKTFTRTVPSGYGNESLSFGYSSIAQYASTDDTQMIDMMIHCGYGSDYKHLPYYPILPMDSILGVKYIYSQNDVYGAKILKNDVMDNVNLYENPYALPIVFAVDTQCKDIEMSEDVFENHERIYSNLAGYDIELYNYPDIQLIDTDGKTWNTWNIKIEEDGPLYLYFKYCNPDMAISVDGTQIAKVAYYTNHVMYIGYYTKGDVVCVKTEGGAYMEDYGISAATLCEDNFKKVINLFQADCANIVSKSYTGMTIKYAGKERKRLLLTIPYDDGWKFSVNGKNIRPEKVAGNFIGIDIDQGINILTMEYCTPGLKIGVVLSILGILGFLLSKKYWLK